MSHGTPPLLSAKMTSSSTVHRDVLLDFPTTNDLVCGISVLEETNNNTPIFQAKGTYHSVHS